MAVEIDFNPYLKSLREHYAQWSKFYTITDAEAKVAQTGGAPQWLTPFDFGLMVRTVPAERAIGANRPHSSHQGSLEKIERFPVLEGIRKFVAEHRQVLLIGRPGSGKSTTLARLLLETAEAADKIPVLIELRLWSSSVVDLIRDFFLRHGLLREQAQIEELLFHQRLYLLIDGLNELPSEAARLDVAKLRQNYPKAPMLFTTRDLSLGGDFGLEKKLEMQPLTEDQMKAFVRAHLPNQAEAMLSQLRDRLRELGETPLLLWMLCGLFRQTGQIPANLGEVFRAFTQGYERVLKADISVESDRRWWPELLQELAFWMMRGVPFGEEAPKVDVEFRVAISKVEARQIFTAFLQNKEPQAEGAAQRYLDDLLKHHLIEPNGEKIEFRHQLIQEYYAAEALLKRLQSNQISDIELKQCYLNYLKWTEPTVLMLALAQDENLIMMIIDAAISVDLMLGARFAGAVNPVLQYKTIGFIQNLHVPKFLIIELLGETCSESAIPLLASYIDDPDFTVAQQVVRNLAHIRNPQVLPVLREKLAFLQQEYYEDPPQEYSIPDAKFDLWSMLIDLIGHYSPTEVIPILRNVVFDKSHPVSWFPFSSAINSLIQFDTEYTLKKLLKALENSESSNIRAGAVKNLEQAIDEEFILVKLINILWGESDQTVRENLVKTIMRFTSQLALDTLIELLKDANSKICKLAVEALIDREDIQSAECQLQQLLNHDDWYIGWRAALILSHIRNTAALPKLLEGLKSENRGIRRTAALMLGKLGDEQVILPLNSALQDYDYSVRRSAAISLGNLGRNEAAQELISAFNHYWPVKPDNNARVGVQVGERFCAIEGMSPENLMKIGDQHSIETWLLENTCEVSERHDIIKALGNLGITEPLWECLQTQKNGWEVAAFMLVKLGNKEVIPKLIWALNESQSELSREIIDFLSSQKDISVPEKLISALYEADLPNQDVSPFFRQRIAIALSRGNAEVNGRFLPTLSQLLINDNAKEMLWAIYGIQDRCKFYNYDLTQVTQSMKLFFSYAHKDEPLRDELAKHLSLLKRQNIITDWHDRNITAGTDWAQAIDDNLNTADIILLLISSDFIHSKYCWTKEMDPALERHNQGTARVIPVILRPCDWQNAPFSKLQALPRDAKPVTKWDDQDEAFTNIVQGIRKAVAELQQHKGSPATPQLKATSPPPRNVTMNFYGTVHGAAGIVQENQNIQPEQ